MTLASEEKRTLRWTIFTMILWLAVGVYLQHYVNTAKNLDLPWCKDCIGQEGCPCHPSNPPARPYCNELTLVCWTNVCSTPSFGDDGGDFPPVPMRCR